MQGSKKEREKQEGGGGKVGKEMIGAENGEVNIRGGMSNTSLTQLGMRNEELSEGRKVGGVGGVGRV
jgi:hypothetical protein